VNFASNFQPCLQTRQTADLIGLVSKFMFHVRRIVDIFDIICHLVSHRSNNIDAASPAHARQEDGSDLGNPKVASLTTSNKDHS